MSYTRKTRSEPQTYSDMVMSAEEKRTTSGLYGGGDDTDLKLSALVAASAEEIARVIDNGGKVNLADTAMVQKRGIAYLRACSEGSCLPSMSGFARSLGMSTRALNDFKQRNPLHPTSEFLQLLHDSMADVLADAAIRNGSGINTIFAIFLEKARFSWRDNVTLEISQPQKDQLSYHVTPEQVARFSSLPEDGTLSTKNALQSK